MNTKELYDEMCHLLTDYESQCSEGICNGVSEEDFYNMLVKIQNNWEYINND